MENNLVNPNSLKTKTEDYENRLKGEEANKRLKDLGKFVAPEGPAYLGSMAVHVMAKENQLTKTKLVFVIPQVITNGVGMDQNEAVAALTELKNTMLVFFGLTPPAKRKDLK